MCPEHPHTTQTFQYSHTQPGLLLSAVYQKENRSEELWVSLSETLSRCLHLCTTGVKLFPAQPLTTMNLPICLLYLDEQQLFKGRLRQDGSFFSWVRGLCSFLTLIIHS